MIAVIQKYIKKNMKKEYQYYNTLSSKLEYINTEKNPKIQKLEKQVANIKNIITQIQYLNTMDDLLNNLTQYFYLKKEIK